MTSGSSSERLDEHNGLLLAPYVDFLFDGGFLSFEPGGEMILSPVLDLQVARALGHRPYFEPQCGVVTPNARKTIAGFAAGPNRDEVEGELELGVLMTMLDFWLDR